MNIHDKYILLNDLIVLYKKNFKNEANTKKYQILIAKRIESLSKEVNNNFINTKYFYGGLTSIKIKNNLQI